MSASGRGNNSICRDRAVKVPLTSRRTTCTDKRTHHTNEWHGHRHKQHKQHKPQGGGVDTCINETENRSYGGLGSLYMNTISHWTQGPFAEAHQEHIISTPLFGPSRFP